MTDNIGLVYSKIKIKLLGSIWSGAVCDENQVGQWPDWSYMYDLHWKLN